MSEKPKIVKHPEISTWRRPEDSPGLRKDLKQSGQLQNLIFRKLKDGTLELLAGNRRYDELVTLEVPFEEWDKKILTNVSDRDALLIAMSENRFRKELSAVEEGRMFQSMKKLKMGIDEISFRYKCSKTYVRNRLELLKLPEKIQVMMEKGELEMSYAKPINRLAGLEEWQLDLAKAIIEGKKSYYGGVKNVDEANDYVSKVLTSLKYMKELVAKYGPCPECGSKDISEVAYPENKIVCKTCNYAWHKETKDPWDYFALKEQAEKIGLKVDIGKGKAKITQKDIGEVIKRIKQERAEANATEKPLPKTMRSVRHISELLAPFIKARNIHLFRVEGDRVEIKLVEDCGMRFSARRHEYRTGEKSQVRPLSMWGDRENQNPRKVKQFIDSLEMD